MHMFLANPGDWWEHIERLGGWGVVAWIVIWGVQRMNKRDDQLTELIDQHRAALDVSSMALSDLSIAVASLKGLESEEHRFHLALESKVDRILENTGGPRGT